MFKNCPNKVRTETSNACLQIETNSGLSTTVLRHTYASSLTSMETKAKFNEWGHD